MDVSYLAQKDHVKCMGNNVEDNKAHPITRIVKWLCSVLFYILRRYCGAMTNAFLTLELFRLRLHISRDYQKLKDHKNKFNKPLETPTTS